MVKCWFIRVKGWKPLPASLFICCPPRFVKTCRLLIQLGSPPAFDFPSAGFSFTFIRSLRAVTCSSWAFCCQPLQIRLLEGPTWTSRPFMTAKTQADSRKREVAAAKSILAIQNNNVDIQSSCPLDWMQQCTIVFTVHLPVLCRRKGDAQKFTLNKKRWQDTFLAINFRFYFQNYLSLLNGTMICDYFI